MLKFPLVISLSLLCPVIFSPPCFAHYFQKDVCIANRPKGDIVSLQPVFQTKNLESFLNQLGHDQKLGPEFMRCIAATADSFGLEESGFRLEFKDNGFGALLLNFKIPHHAIKNPSISPKMAYNSENSFHTILSRKGQKDVTFTTHTATFKSFSSNILVIPREGYVSIYDYSKKASDTEILNMWHQLHETTRKLHKAGVEFVLATHSGTAAGQTVPHLHWRFEIKKQ